MLYYCLLYCRTLLLRLVKFTVLISVCTHFVACLWYILGCQAGTCHSGTWASTASLVNTTVDDADHYLNSLYWSMATMTTTGVCASRAHVLILLFLRSTIIIVLNQVYLLWLADHKAYS